MEFGGQSRAAPGHRGALPTLTASVNAFSRMWFGMRSARDLAYTDELGGPPELLTQLDETVRPPQPSPDCEL